MFSLKVERISSLAVIHCRGRMVRSGAAFQLRDAVTRQRDARVVLLDLSEVAALEGGGLGMLLYLRIWAQDRGIQFKAMRPSHAVRQALESSRATAAIEIASTEALLSILGWEPGHACPGKEIRKPPLALQFASRECGVCSRP